MGAGKRIDLNADAGESFGRWRLGDDEALIPQLTSVSIACGFHAGDPGTMRKTARLAVAAGVAIGAHPSLPDRVGFGRREMALSRDQIVNDCCYQVGALQAIAALEGGKVDYVKLHGALYTTVARDTEAAVALAAALAQIDPELTLLMPAGAGAEAAGTRIRVATEAFVDLDYDDEGLPIVKGEYPAVAPELAAQRAVDVADGKIHSQGGREIPIDAHSICIHGDSPNAVALAGAIRERFSGEGIELAPLRDIRITPEGDE